jgi:uncharacterized cupin superfamily protein
MIQRPAFIRNVAELPSSREGYEGDDELFSEGTPLSRPLGLSRLGVHHEVMPPGTRSSWPHAEEKEEEFVLVLEGEPHVWIDGHLHALRAGDAVAFSPGTGIAHTFINDSAAAVRLLVVGERLADNRVYYPHHPEGYVGMAPARKWAPETPHVLGGHDGLPKAFRAQE